MRKKTSLDSEKESSNTPILIKAYGEFWNPELVSWKKRAGRKAWRLLGTRQRNSKGPAINVYEQRGIYVLYNNFKPVYVGKGIRVSIGFRLRQHRESIRKGPRWDRFSWFGLNSIRRNGELGALGKLAHSRSAALISTLEALLIRVIEPPMNSRREQLQNAVLLYQSDEDKPMEIDDRLLSIEKKLDVLMSDQRRLKIFNES